MSEGHCQGWTRGVICGRGSQPEIADYNSGKYKTYIISLRQGLSLSLNEEKILDKFVLWPEHLCDDELLPDAERLGDDVAHSVAQEVDVLPVSRPRGHWHSVE